MRINVGIIPSILSDQHLIAEYAEIETIPRMVRSTNGSDWIEPNETMLLRRNHIYYFKDKLLYLRERKKQLTKEMRFRGFKTNYPLLAINDLPDKFKNNWEPTIEQSRFVRQRIVERLLQKPDWYRYHGTVIGNNNISLFIKNIWDASLFYV
jgi:deoxyribonuclease (pyrimidine dimer)